MLLVLLACHRPSSSPSNDSAPNETTDTGPHDFDPETDLVWHPIDGTDGDCGTAWPLSRSSWEYEDESSGSISESASWTVWSAMGRDDVWDVSLGINVHSDQDLNLWKEWVDARWRVQCDGGALLLMGLVSGVNYWEQHGWRVGVAYAASFASPIEVRLGGASFDVDGELWHQEHGDWPPAVVNPSVSFTGSIRESGTETISTPGGKIEAHELVVDTSSQMFVDVFPHLLWLSESAGLVQFGGPLGGAFVIAD